MVALLDVNLLVALAWPNHVHHRPALDWFSRHQEDGWATCPLTQSGFVRISSNPQVVSEARTPAEAILLLRRILALPHHEFWYDDVSLAAPAFLEEVRLVGHRQVTDAHLLRLAAQRGGRLATLDGRIRNLLPPDRNPAELLSLVLG